MLDALVGAGVALLVSQVLFPPSPTAMLAEAGQRNLELVAGELRAIRRAVEATIAAEAKAEAEAALGRMRDEGLGSTFDLSAVRQTAWQVSRRTLRGRRESDRLRRLEMRLGGANLLEGARLLARAADRLIEERVEAPARLRRAVERLARAVGELAGTPESAAAARRLALEAAEACRTDVPEPDRRAELVAEAARLTADDVLRAAGGSEAEGTAGDRRDDARPEA